jgi:hypothetical protein
MRRAAARSKAASQPSSGSRMLQLQPQSRFVLATLLCRTAPARAERERLLTSYGELGNSGRPLYPWFERHQDVLARGLAAELALDAAHSAVYHVLGASGIASLTAACRTPDRAIAIGELERLVKPDGDTRQRLLFAVAAALYGREQDVSINEVLAELDGADLNPRARVDRAAQAAAEHDSGIARRSLDTRRRTRPGTRRRKPIGARRVASRSGAHADRRTCATSSRPSGVWSLSRCT